MGQHLCIRLSIAFALWLYSGFTFASGELSFTLTSAEHFTVGQPIIIHKELRNVSNTLLIIPKSPLWDNTTIVSEGHQPQKSTGDGPPVRSKDDYRTLAPGQSIEWVEHLSGPFYHLTPGRWTVTMSVGYGTPILEYPLACSGIVQSNALEFSLSE
jgi:hypothetical protein